MGKKNNLLLLLLLLLLPIRCLVHDDHVVYVCVEKRVCLLGFELITCIGWRPTVGAGERTSLFFFCCVDGRYKFVASSLTSVDCLSSFLSS